MKSLEGSIVQPFLKKIMGFKSQKNQKFLGLKSTNLIALKMELPFNYQEKED